MSEPRLVARLPTSPLSLPSPTKRKWHAVTWALATSNGLSNWKLCVFSSSHRQPWSDCRANDSMILRQLTVRAPLTDQVQRCQFTEKHNHRVTTRKSVEMSWKFATAVEFAAHCHRVAKLPVCRLLPNQVKQQNQYKFQHCCYRATIISTTSTVTFLYYVQNPFLPPPPPKKKF